MISKLMQVEMLQDQIINLQRGAIDEMFVLLCQYVNMDEIEPLLSTLMDAAERTEICRR